MGVLSNDCLISWFVQTTSALVQLAGLHVTDTHTSWIQMDSGGFQLDSEVIIVAVHTACTADLLECSFLAASNICCTGCP